MFAIATFSIVVAMSLALARAFLGPSLYDRVLAGNSFGTKTVLLIGVMGFLTGRPDFLDIALLYALINFAATLAILRFFSYKKSEAEPMEPAPLVAASLDSAGREAGARAPEPGE